MHLQTYKKSLEGKGTVIFVHGFMGSPVQFNRLAEVAYAAGFSTLQILLPGHGSGAKDFAKSNMQHWLNALDVEIEKLEGMIILVGHSMGCLLALHTAKKYGARIQGLLLLACPFDVRLFSFNALRMRLRYKKEYIENCSVKISLGLLWYSIKPALEYKRLVKSTMSLVSEINIPTTVIFSTADEVVKVSAAKIIEEKLKHSTIITLENSPHAFYLDYEQKIIEEELKKFFLC